MPKELESVARSIAKALYYWRRFGTSEEEIKKATDLVVVLIRLTHDIVDTLHDADPTFDYDSFLEISTVNGFPGSQF